MSCWLLSGSIMTKHSSISLWGSSSKNTSLFPGAYSSGYMKESLRESDEYLPRARSVSMVLILLVLKPMSALTSLRYMMPF